MEIKIRIDRYNDFEIRLSLGFFTFQFIRRNDYPRIGDGGFLYVCVRISKWYRHRAFVLGKRRGKTGGQNV